MLTTWGGYCSFLVVCAFIRCYRYYFQLLVYSDPEEGTRMVEIATVRRTVAFAGAHTGESGGPENCPADSTGSDPADPRSFPDSPRGRPGWPGSNRFKYRPPPGTISSGSFCFSRPSLPRDRRSTKTGRCTGRRPFWKASVPWQSAAERNHAAPARNTGAA